MITYVYKGYTIAIADDEAAVVCKDTKEKCMPFTSKEAAELCIDRLISGSLKENMFDKKLYPLEITSHESYKIVVISDKTTVIICKKRKGKCIPYFDKEAAQRGAHLLKERVSKESDYIVWDANIFGLD